MKKIIILAILILAGFISFGQKDSLSIPPYKRFPTVPPINLLRLDSNTYLTKANLKKNRAVLLIIFNPDCEHCQHETEEILKNIDSFRNIQIVMATMMPFGMMKEFNEKYGLAKFKNIFVGQDTKYVLPSFYGAHSLPYLAMYNKKWNLITTFEGSLAIPKILGFFNSK